MIRFTLSVIDADHIILSTPEPLAYAHWERVHDAFERWKKDGGVLVLTECQTIDARSVSIELDLDVESEDEQRRDRAYIPRAR